MIHLMTKSKVRLYLVLFTLCLAMTARSEPNIQDLEWMTGTWRGAFGTMEIEESWNEPRAGIIQAMVRLSNENKLMIIEMIVIEEIDDSLRLHIQQWDPGMIKHDPEKQRMDLVSIGERSVSFEAIDEGLLKKLTYKRTSETDFEIHVEQTSGQSFTVNLVLIKL